MAREPGDLVKGFLRVPFPDAERTRHAYDNATTFVLARMVERVTGRGLPELLDERLFAPVAGSAPHRSGAARIDASAAGSARPDGTEVVVEPMGDEWLLHLGP